MICEFHRGSQCSTSINLVVSDRVLAIWAGVRFTRRYAHGRGLDDEGQFPEDVSATVCKQGLRRVGRGVHEDVCRSFRQDVERQAEAAGQAR